jgi:hypothetical protein
MQNITIGRFDKDPEAQGAVTPEDGRWQLVIDGDGYPHLYVQAKTEDGQVGLFCLEDMLPGGLTTRDMMDGGAFGGQLSPDEEREAAEAFERDRATRKIPCPRPPIGSKASL